MVDSVFGRRLGLGVISEVLLSDGSDAVGSEEVIHTLHDHFKKQFEAQGSSWHEEPELDTAMRALFADSKAGSKAREIILRGV